MYANVAIDINNPNINEEYVYIIPDNLLPFVSVGSRVLVDFGVRRLLGYVLSISETTTFSGDIREIVDVLDFINELTIEQVSLAQMMKRDIGCSMIQALDCMLPSFMKGKYKKYAMLVNENDVDPNIYLLFDSKKKIALSKEIVQKYPRIKKEIEKGNITIDYDVYVYGNSKYEKVYTVNSSNANLFTSLSSARRNVIDFLLAHTDNSVDSGKTLNELREYLSCSSYLIQNMVDNNLLIESKRPMTSKQKNKKSVLTPNLKFDFDKKNIVDRFINGSFQTPYLFSTNDKQFEKDFILASTLDILKKGKNVLIVSPTIVEHYAILYYLDRYISDEIVCFSSDISPQEYYENYKIVKNGNARVVLTTKVGVFSPLDNIGLIIIVDESNYNYTSESTPKYNVVQMLKFRANIHNAKVALLSNPLTIDNYYNYTTGKYNLLKYNKPINSTSYLVDMKEEALMNNTIISSKLEEEIANTLRRGNQAMLLLNVRGYSNHLVCPKCGKVAKCEKCNIPLTFSKEKNEVSCRYCGRKLDDLQCKCGNSNYQMFGFGLEKVKEEVKRLFPKAKTLLIDANTLREFDDYKHAFVKIEAKEVDIIIGTSTILSLTRESSVDLFGVISVDSMINLNDYKASYQTFYYLYNGLEFNTIVLQGYYLNHYAINCALNNDFNGFYEKEIEYRRENNYPPFSQINKVLITGDYSDMYYCANYIRKVYNTVSKTDERVLGPTYVKTKKSVQLIIKNDDFEKLKKIIDEAKKKFATKKIQIGLERYTR